MRKDIKIISLNFFSKNLKILLLDFEMLRINESFIAWYCLSNGTPLGFGLMEGEVKSRVAVTCISTMYPINSKPRSGDLYWQPWIPNNLSHVVVTGSPLEFIPPKAGRG